MVNSIKKTKAHFDRIASKDSAKSWHGNIDKWDVIQDFFHTIPPRSKILECGAGTGMYTISMLECGHLITAVDLSTKALEVTKEIALKQGVEERLTILHGEFNKATRMLCQEFDAVTYFKTLHYFANLISIHEAIFCGYELLKPGGQLIGFEPNGACPFWRLRYRNGSIWEHEKNLSLITYPNLGNIFKKLRNATWEIQYHYVIPATFVRKIPLILSSFNKLLLLTPLKYTAVNLSFRVKKKD